MSGETFITIKGRLTGAPELRFTKAGDAVAGFTVASNARRYDKNSNEWQDKPATFWRCNAWKEMGEAVAESLDKGQAVILSGEVESREWQDKEGNNRTSLELRVDAIGADLRWAKPSGNRQPQGQPQADPWGSGDDSAPF